ncbi:hypothetical protein EV426DRAFT_720130 [Tirmania nivea]|nr:hypothetical protein EV426DRAFT_720130 [Tirmania nivea]
MDKADSAGASRSPDARRTRSTLLKVSPISDLAGYTYGGSHGRYAVFFWQTASNDYSSENSENREPASIYQSTFRKTDPGWTLVSRPILVAVNARKQSPLAAVTWSNGVKAAVYYLNAMDIICEKVTIDCGKTWHYGSLTEWTIPARSNSDLAAVVTWESLRCMEIFVYFQDESNRIRELRFEPEECEWYEDCPTGIHLLKGMSGTSIACAADSVYGVKRWIYNQSTARECFDRKVRLGYCTDWWYWRLYAHDGSKVLELQRGDDYHWKDQVVLPMSTGTAKIKGNFIVLLWPQDVDNTVSEGAVYYLNEIDLICEQVTTDSGKTWHGGSLTGWSIPARSNSDLAAVVTWESLRCMEIFVYFQDENNRIRELRFESEKSEWYEDSPPGIDLLKGLSGTSIVCGADSTHGIKRWMYSQSTAREVQQCRYEANRTEWILEDSKIQYFSQCFDRKVRLGYCIDQCSIGIYAHDGSKVLEKVWQRGPCWKWKDQVILPMSTGTATIKENFVVLLWPQDVDNTVSEVHLFSTEGNVLHDYLVGPATGGKFSLI